MKTFFKILGIALAVILLIAIIGASWISFGSMPTYPTQTIQLKATPDSTSLAQAEKMATYICATCHKGEDRKLSGTLFTEAESAFGEIYSANITQHPKNGIGKYTDEELAYFFRTGIKKDGTFAGPFMIKPNLSDKDLAALIQYLRSDAHLVQPSNNVKPPAKYSFLAKALFKLGALSPTEYSEGSYEHPNPNNTITYGKYLVSDVYECFNCHSASFETTNLTEPEKSEGYFGGGTLIEMPGIGAVVSRNITMHPDYGIGKWTKGQFALAVRKGIRPDGNALTPLMPKFEKLTDQEIHAIWEYLQTVPKIKGNFVKE